MLSAFQVARTTTKPVDNKNKNVELGPLFALTREAVAVASADAGRIERWNPAAEQLFGWSAPEAVGRRIDELISPAILRLHRAGLDADRPFEIPALTREGTQVCLEVSVTTLNAPDTSAAHILALMRDVTHRRRATQLRTELAQVASARETAEQAVRQQAVAVRDASACVRREAGRMRHTIDHLGQQPSRRARLRARVLQLRLDRLVRHIELLAVYTEIEADTLELKLERVNLVPVIAGIVARARLRHPSHRLNTALPQGLTALVDAERLEQAVQVLLDNAVARCPSGCWIDLDLRRPLTGLARIEIRDFGKPASVETRRLADDSEAEPDLALARAIVALHGGTLHFEFLADGGIRAVVTVPTQRARVATTVV